MSTLIKDGSHVIEMFASSFEDFIKTHTKYKHTTDLFIFH